MARQYTRGEIERLRILGDTQDFTLDNETGLYSPKSYEDKKSEEAAFDAANHSPSVMETLIKNPKNVAFNPTLVEPKGDIAFPAAGPFKPEATPNIVQALLNTYHSPKTADREISGEAVAQETGPVAGTLAGIDTSKLPGEVSAEASPTSPMQGLTERALASLENYRNAQNASNNAQASAGIGKSLNLINAGMSRSQVTPAQNAVFDDNAKMGQDIEDDYLKQVEFQKHDASSPISKVYNNFMKQLGVNIPEGHSAADLEKLSPLIFKQQEARLAREAKDLAAKQSMEFREAEAAKDRASREANAKMFAEISKDRIEGTKAQRNVGNIGKIQTDFNKDKLVIKAEEGLKAAHDAEDLLETDNPITAEAVKTSLARLSGEVGVLTDRDVARFGGSKAAIARINQSVKQMYDGKLTEENKAFMKQILQVFKARREEELDERAKLHAQQGGKRLGVDEQEAYDYIRPGVAFPTDTPRSRSPQGTSPEEDRKIQIFMSKNPSVKSPEEARKILKEAGRL